jgi:hypothetical protein
MLSVRSYIEVLVAKFKRVRKKNPRTKKWKYILMLVSTDCFGQAQGQMVTQHFHLGLPLRVGQSSTTS